MPKIHSFTLAQPVGTAVFERFLIVRRVDAEVRSLHTLLTLYASITMPMAAAPRIVSPNGTIGTHALLRAVDQADSSARGRTYIAPISELLWTISHPARRDVSGISRPAFS